jgi:hypothetical protein
MNFHDTARCGPYTRTQKSKKILGVRIQSIFVIVQSKVPDVDKDYSSRRVLFDRHSSATAAMHRIA